MPTVTLEEAQAHLPELIERLKPGEGIVIVQGTQPVAQLLSPPAPKARARFGSCKGMLVILQEDDEHLKDFADYME
ncbi:MAG: hypothetical protein K2R98_30225 [Gemmataceae bacterium]|nr:hypothetical protein [Gemmataceae bacterium]